MGRSFVFPVLVLTGAFIARSAAGQSESDRSSAEALFQEGKRLLADGKLEEACPKFLLSQRLDGGVGTLLYLADCYERSGKLASAWTRFLEAAGEAQKQGDTKRERIAKDRAGALEPVMPRLGIRVAAGANVEGVEVRRDGQLVDRAMWNVAVPLDPGPHVIEANAKGYASWRRTVTLAVRQGPVMVEIERLEPTSADRTTPSSSVDDQPQGSGSARKTLGFIAIGIGAIGVGIGTWAGASASSTWKDAQAERSNELAREAGTAADISTVAFVVGGVALAGGSVLLLTAPGPSRSTGSGPRYRMAPWASANGAGLIARGEY